MQKIVGSIMVIVACTAMGFDKSFKLQSHLNTLETLKNIFVLIKKEIQYTREPLAEIFKRVGKKQEGSLGKWLQQISMELQKRGQGTFYEIWVDSIENNLREIKLSLKEKEDLNQVGKNMGYEETIDIYLEQLTHSIEQTREEVKSKKKMYQSIGIMCGVFLVILLL